MNAHLFDRKAVIQVCFVTDDLDKTARWFASLLGQAVPEFITSGPHAEAQTEYLGAPSDARCSMAFFKLENLEIELIQPDQHPSCWRDFLVRNGPGVHHLAFQVSGMKQKIAAFGEAGYALLQKGEFQGGRYAYVNTETQMGILLELLEFDNRK